MYNKAYIEIINTCNLNCSFCPKTKRAPSVISKENFSYILDQVLPITKYVYLHVVGEPTTHPDLKEIIAIGIEKGAKITITTNGTRLSYLYDCVKNNPIYKVNISLTMTAGNNINIEEYISDVVKYSDMFSSMGILTVLRLWNKGGDTKLNGEIIKKLQEAFGFFVFNDSGSTTIRKCLYIEGDESFTWKQDEEKSSGYCMGLKDQFAILVDGTVVPCCIDNDGDIPLGNIYKEKIEDILNSDRALALRKGLEERKLVEERCKHCGFNKKFDL